MRVGGCMCARVLACALQAGTYLIRVDGVALDSSKKFESLIRCKSPGDPLRSAIHVRRYVRAYDIYLGIDRRMCVYP